VSEEYPNEVQNNPVFTFRLPDHKPDDDETKTKTVTIACACCKFTLTFVQAGWTFGRVVCPECQVFEGKNP
jgi:hypothetical protein